MRVLAFCDYYDQTSIGGAERVAREVYSRLAEEYGNTVKVLGAVPRRSSARGGVAAQSEY
jgi:hypothetical protein